MRVHYEPRAGALQPYYVCNEAVVRHASGNPCQWIRGATVDAAVAELLQTVAPAVIRGGIDRAAHIHVRWRGGRTQTLQAQPPKPMALVRKTRPEVVALIDSLLEGATDKQVAVRLNELGLRNYRGEPFTMKKVILVRETYQRPTSSRAASSAFASAACSPVSRWPRNWAYLLHGAKRRASARTSSRS